MSSKATPKRRLNLSGINLNMISTTMSRIAPKKRLDLGSVLISRYLQKSPEPDISSGIRAHSNEATARRLRFPRSGGRESASRHPSTSRVLAAARRSSSRILKSATANCGQLLLNARPTHTPTPPVSQPLQTELAQITTGRPSPAAKPGRGETTASSTTDPTKLTESNYNDTAHPSPRPAAPEAASLPAQPRTRPITNIASDAAAATRVADDSTPTGRPPGMQTPHELEGIRSPVNSLPVATDLFTTPHSFDQPTTTDEDFVRAVLALHSKRTTALANSIAKRDSSLRSSNHQRRPAHFSIGDFVFVNTAASSKNSPSLTDPCEIIDIIDGYTYVLYNHTTKGQHHASVSNIRRADPPGDSAQEPALTDASTTTAAAIVETTDDDVQVVAFPFTSPAHVFVNKRPSAARTQQRWCISRKTAQPARQLLTFHFDRSSQGHLILPRHTADTLSRAMASPTKH